MPFASTSTVLLCCLAASASAAAAPSPSSSFWRGQQRKRDVPAQGYFTPSAAGGSMLTTVFNTFPPGLKEPVNLIISANSDADVLKLGDGWTAYYNSIGFAGECLGQHIGVAQQADLGDGNGLLNQTAEERWAYGDLNFGTCKETINGGNHFRWWVQNGTSGDSGAIFLAASYEQPLAQGHDIIPNGYDLGRDWLVGNATLAGGTSSANWTFNTTVEMVSGLLENGSDGINHGIAIDGYVAVLTVKVTKRPSSKDSAVSGSPASFAVPTFALLGVAAWLI